MLSSKLTTLQQIGLTLVIGTFLISVGLVVGKPDIDSQIRSLAPDELNVGTMILSDYDEERGAAMFEVVGAVPQSMKSFELVNNRNRWKTVRWKSTSALIDTYEGHQNCSCFACAEDPKICNIAAEWLEKDGSLFYLNSNPTGANYLLNREDQRLIIVWNRAL